MPTPPCSQLQVQLATQSTKGANAKAFGTVAGKVGDRKSVNKFYKLTKRKVGGTSVGNQRDDATLSDLPT